VAIYLIRHAHAGDRQAWGGDDDERPLDARGRKQAEHLATELADEPISRIFSSRATRCIETVEPLAAGHGLEITVARELAEGADADDAIAFLLEHEPANTAMVSHGDLIPKIIRRLNTSGLRTKDANISQKGSVWVLVADEGSFVRGRYHPPG
jgi:8-oxo-dGTP diphosphatase